MREREPTSPLTAVTIGNFDGVHVGHSELLRRARLAVGPEGRVVALAFDPHPMSVLAPHRAPDALTTFDQRRDLLLSAGADAVEQLVPTPELLATSPEDFLRRIVDTHAPAAIVEGADFRFGHARSGDVETLRQIGHQWLPHGHGFETLVVDPVEVPLSCGAVMTASSTIVRWLIERGRTTDAAIVLGRPHAIQGEVVQGDQRGRTIGVPTANLRTPNPLPADGVYAAIADLPDGRSLTAAVHIGPRQTFDNEQRTIEAHVIDWAGPGTTTPDDTPVHDYGWHLTVRVLAFLRDQARYDSVELLCEQMARDIARAHHIAARHLQPATEPTTT